MMNLIELIQAGYPIHLSGIGGISMMALAQLLHSQGAVIQGSDRDESPNTLALRQLGIDITIGHLPHSVEGAALIIRTAAITDTNPEIAHARQLGIPVLERAQAWGQLMEGYDNAVCIAGTHGKTTTTSMTAIISEQAAFDPTVMVGGSLANFGGSLRIGHGDTIIVESCEYKNSFLNFRPSVAVILNIDRDHLDFFDDTDNIIDSFRKFALLVPKTGVVVANYDDANTMAAVKDLDRPILTFGYGEGAHVRGINPMVREGFWRCEIAYHGQRYATCAPAVPGRFNLTNALAAAAVSIRLGISGQDFSRGLARYTGVGRRFELKKRWRDAIIFDDYAHHPNELRAALETARSLTHGRVICLFQPHTYSRTASLMDEFAQALALADHAILCPIYGAREEPIDGVTAQALADLVPGSLAVRDFPHAAALLAQMVRPGDFIITMGAGDVYKIVDLLQ